jgi:hypothetical protein
MCIIGNCESKPAIPCGFFLWRYQFLFLTQPFCELLGNSCEDWLSGSVKWGSPVPGADWIPGANCAFVVICHAPSTSCSFWCWVSICSVLRCNFRWCVSFKFQSVGVRMAKYLLPYVPWILHGRVGCWMVNHFPLTSSKGPWWDRFCNLTCSLGICSLKGWHIIIF